MWLFNFTETILVVIIIVHRCLYCEADDLFELYKTKLYRFDEKDEKSRRRRKKIEMDVEEENGGGEKKEESICFEKGRRGNQGDSDLELVLKFLLGYSRRFKGIFFFQIYMFISIYIYSVSVQVCIFKHAIYLYIMYLFLFFPCYLHWLKKWPVA